MDRDSHRHSKVRRRDKVLAACTGATITSLTMTPFDVVKTRLQTAPVPPPLFQPSPSLAGIPTCCQPTFFSTNSSDLACRFDPRTQHLSIPPPAPSPVPRPSLYALSASAVASSSSSSAVSMSCEFPDAPAAARRLSSSPSSTTGIWSMISSIVKSEGPMALWRGVAPALAMSIPAQAVYMVGYDSLRRTAFVYAPRIAYLDPASPCRPLPNGTGLKAGYMNGAAPLMAGCISRTIVATLFSPLELLRTRLQSHPGPTSSPTLPTSSRSILRATFLEVRTVGISTLWKGLGATLWRDVPFSGIYWASYEVVRRKVTGGRGLGEKVEGSNGSKMATIVASFASGSASGCTAAILTNPFDVVKTKRQAEMLAWDNAPGTKTSRTVQRDGTWKVLKRVWREEGVGGLRKGLSPRLAKIVPACGIMIASYEGLAQILADLA